MRKLMRIAGRVLAIAAVVLLAAGLWKRDEIMRLWAVNSLFAEDRIVANFSKESLKNLVL